MKKTKLTRSLLAACSIVALSAVMYGCSSSGENAANTRAQNAEEALAALQAAYDGEGDLTVAALDQLEADLATAQGDLMTAQGQITTLTGERDALQAQISGDPADPMDTGLNGQIADLNGQITTLTGQRDALQAQVSGDPADPMDTGLMGQIADLNGQITTLTGERDALQMQVSGDPADPADGGLMGQIAALNVQISGDPADPNDTGLMGQIADLRGQITTLTGERNTAQGIVAGFETAQGAADAATAATTAATDSVKAAMEKSAEITTLTVNGDSATAEANAQAVLDAQDDLNGAITAAKSALEAAETALGNVDDSNAAGVALKAALEAAIADAKAAIETAEKAAEGADLRAAVQLVTLAPSHDDHPRTPAQIARGVAEDIAMALQPESDTDGAANRRTHGTTAPADTIEGAVQMNDHQGMTWEEIVTGGGGTVIDARISTGATTTSAVKATSVGGTATDLHASALTTTGGANSDGVYADGFQTDNTGTYKGIPGTVFCGGSDCKVEDVDGTATATGSWYFTPASPMEWYTGTTDDAGVTTYAVETMYTRFGHWLTDDTTDAGNAHVNTFATSTGGAASGLDVTTVNTAPDATTLTDTSATYSGTAAGMSVEKVTDTDGKVTQIDSGAFTADVSLKATFAAAPTLGGTIDNFQGPATDSNWSVELQVTAFTGAEVAATAGRTIATGRDGQWSATGYGASGERPAGIFGGFNAHFTDGHVAGAYATRKD